MKKRLVICLIVLSIALVAALCSCGGTSDTTVNVSFSTDGGNDIPSVEVKVGEKLSLLTEPKKEGSVFGGWFFDAELTKPVENSVYPTEDVTLYVKWLDDVSSLLNCTSTDGGYRLDGVNLTVGIKEILLPKKYDGRNIIEIGDGVFKNNTTVEKVIIEGNVEKIGAEAFKNCTALTSINLPDSVKDVGRDAFTGCTALVFEETGNLRYLGNWVIAPKSQTLVVAAMKSTTRGIVAGALKDCASLTFIEIPSSVERINDEAFSGCSKLERVSFGETPKLEYLGKAAFKNCSSLLSVSIKNDTVIGIPAKVGKIEEETFSGCLKLTSPSLPEGISEIGDRAFAHCRAFTSFTVPKDVTKIGEMAFYGNVLLEKVDFAESGKLVSIGNGAFEQGLALLEISLPVGIRSVGSRAFYGCVKLTSANVPSGVSAFGESVFSGCTALTELVLPFVGDNTPLNTHFGYAFGGADYTQNSAVVPSTLKKVGIGKGNVGNYAFYGLPELIEISLPVGLTKIGTWAFAECQKLTTVALSDNTADIGAFAFYNCQKLTNVDSRNNSGVVERGAFNFLSKSAKLTNLDEGLFWNCFSLQSAAVPASAEKIGYKCFYNCGELETVTVYAGIDEIGAYAFFGCSSLIDFKVPIGVKEIGSYAFENCANLLTMGLADSVVTLGKGIFNGCTELQYPLWGNVKYLGLWAFGVAEATVSEISLKPTTVGIYDFAFDGCSQIGDVIMETALKYIGDSAFRGCSSIHSISIPANVEYIGEDAFTGCYLSSFSVDSDNSYFKAENGVLFDYTQDTLVAYPCGMAGSSYTVPSSVRYILPNAFNGATRLSTVTIPETVTMVKENVFKGCSGLYVNCDTEANIEEWENGWFGDAYVFTGDNSVASVNGYVYFIIDENLYGIIKGGNSAVLFAYKNSSSAVTFTVPYSVIFNGFSIPVRCIGKNAFTGAASLRSVTIHETVTMVKENAFEGCSGLYVNCDIEANIEEWENGWFGDAYVFTNDNRVASVDGYVYIIIDKNLYGVKEGKAVLFAYKNDSSAVTFAVPGSVSFNDTSVPVAEIGKNAFTGAARLSSVTIPATVTMVKENAFKGCSGLYVNCDTAANIEEWENGWFGDAYVFTNDNRVASVDGYVYFILDKNLYGVKEDKAVLVAYKDDSSAVLFAVPDSVSFNGEPVPVAEIGRNAFLGSPITEIVLGENVTEVSAHGMTRVDSLYVYILAIADNASDLSYGGLFDNCSVLYLEESLTQLNTYVSENFTAEGDDVTLNTVVYKRYVHNN